MHSVGMAPDPWLRPHVAAIEASVRAGFRFWHLPSPANVLAVQGFRVSSGAMDMYLARDRHDAIAARFRVADLECGTPPALWYQAGAVNEVVGKLLELPEHGMPGAPMLARKAVSELWVPAMALL